MDSILQFLVSVIYIIPFIVLYAAGIVLSLMNRRKMLKASLYALVGFTLLLIGSLVSLVYIAWLHFWLLPNNDTLLLSRVIMVQGAVIAILSFIATIFIMAAIFVKRDYTTQS